MMMMSAMPTEPTRRLTTTRKRINRNKYIAVPRTIISQGDTLNPNKSLQSTATPQQHLFPASCDALAFAVCPSRKRRSRPAKRGDDQILFAALRRRALLLEIREQIRPVL